jgi:hypothetical protein
VDLCSCSKIERKSGVVSVNLNLTANEMRVEIDKCVVDREEFFFGDIVTFFMGLENAGAEIKQLEVANGIEVPNGSSNAGVGRIGVELDLFDFFARRSVEINGLGNCSFDCVHACVELERLCLRVTLSQRLSSSS